MNSNAASPIQQRLNSLTLKDYAKQTCKKCHGRGYTAMNQTTKRLVLCSCAKKNYAAVHKMVQSHNASWHALPWYKKAWQKIPVRLLTFS